MTSRIEIIQAVMQGKPVIRNTRIPFELLLRKLAEGATVADLLDAYPRLTEDDLRACRHTPRRRLPTRKCTSSVPVDRLQMRFLADERVATFRW
jgi:uncharacterized protein (DUF433 family)